MLRHRPYLLLLLFLFGFGSRVHSHQESGPWSCDSGSEIRLETDFKPGVITLDGHADDWKDIDASYFPLLPALDPDAENEFKTGKMSVKVTLHFISFRAVSVNSCTVILLHKLIEFK